MMLIKITVDPMSIVWALVILVGLALILALALALASKFLKVEEDPRIERTIELLPGANCGGCGYPGCAGFASGLVSGEIKNITKCKVIKKEKAVEIKDYLNSTPGAEGETAKVDL